MQERDDRKLIYKALKDMKIYHRLDDYYDVGLVGLARGIKTYNENLGYNRSTYYMNCIMNEIRKEITKENRKKRLSDISKISLNIKINNGESSSELIDFIQDNKSDIEKEILKKEKINEIKVFINTKLKKKYKDIFISYYINEIPVTKIAEEYGVTTSMIHFYIRKIKKMIKKGIESYEF